MRRIWILGVMVIGLVVTTLCPLEAQGNPRGGTLIVGSGMIAETGRVTRSGGCRGTGAIGSGGRGPGGLIGGHRHPGAGGGW